MIFPLPAVVEVQTDAYWDVVAAAAYAEGRAGSLGAEHNSAPTLEAGHLA